MRPDANTGPAYLLTCLLLDQNLILSDVETALTMSVSKS